MKALNAWRGSLGLVAATGFSTVLSGCGSDFTCVESRTCPSGVAPGGSAGSSGSGGSGAAGSAGAQGAGADSGAGDSGSSGATGEAGSSDGGGNETDAGPDVEAGADAGPDAPSCETAQPDLERGIFVSNSGNDGADGSMCGAIGSPCATIKRALGLAKTNSVIYLDAGTYEEDGLALRGDVTLQGGWARRTDGKWSHACGPDAAARAVLRAKSADRTLSAVDLGGVATLETLAVRSKTAPAAAGVSVYGIFATGITTRLLLRDVAIEVGAAGAGATGANGKDGGQVPPACPAGTGQAGTAAGLAGAGAPSATFNVTGFLPAAGVEGGSGSNGAPGTEAPPAPCEACPHELAACQASCPSNPCKSVVCGWTNLVTICGGPGTSGCGGEGGRGGAPGGGGGSSVGVFLWNATMTIESGRIGAAAGGAGGPGGKGGNGVPGGAGYPGSAKQCGGCGPVSEVSCGIQPRAMPGGLPGGTGGAGKAGGPGGGGAGGHSYAIYKGNSAIVNVAAGVELVAGAPGSGGGAAPSKGANGAAKPIGP
jgi:hypothetical protein